MAEAHAHIISTHTHFGRILEQKADTFIHKR